MRMFVFLWQNGQQDIAMKALEVLCENSNNPAEVLIGLRFVKTQMWLEEFNI